MKNTATELELHFSSFEEREARAICNIGDEAWLSHQDLCSIIDTNYNWSDNELYFCNKVEFVLEHILQKARTAIKKETGYDFMKDFSWSEEKIHIHATCPFRNTEYAFSREAYNELHNKISRHLELLNKDKFCSYFLSELERNLE